MRCTFSFLFIVFCSLQLYAEPKASFWDDTPADQLVEQLLDAMSDEELLGQVFLLGYSGTIPSPEILEWISARSIGGVKIFGWNASNLGELAVSISAMQRAAQETEFSIPLFVATDQEGGWVRHVKGETSVTAGNMAIGATGLAYDAFQSGWFIGIELRTLGINMNFAPTVDVYTNPQAQVIGPRAFSDDPLQISMLSIAFFKGLDSAGIISTAKHFPGHGDADKDSHGTLPAIDVSLETMWERELLPYRFLSREGLPAVMSGHLGFPNILPEEMPASLSRFFQTEILRNRIGFEGIVITDDLRMHGARHNGLSLPEICIQALEAGNDMIMLSRTPGLNDDVWTALMEKYTAEPEFRERIREAVSRILMTKIAYIKSKKGVPLYPDAEEIERHFPSEPGKNFFFDLACRSVTVLKEKFIPFNPAGDDVKILLAGQFTRFLDAGGKRYPQADRFYFPYSPFETARQRDIRQLTALAPGYDYIIFCLANPNSLEVLSTLRETGTPVLVISALTPIYLKEVPWVESAIAVYGTGKESFEAGFAVLKGDFEAEGTIPLTVFKDMGSP